MYELMQNFEQTQPQTAVSVQEMCWNPSNFHFYLLALSQESQGLNTEGQAFLGMEFTSMPN